MKNKYRLLLSIIDDDFGDIAKVNLYIYVILIDYEDLL